MNNSISFRRTVLYARKHYAENARYYGYGLLAILILLSVFAWPDYLRVFSRSLKYPVTQLTRIQYPKIIV